MCNISATHRYIVDIQLLAFVIRHFDFDIGAWHPFPLSAFPLSAFSCGTLPNTIFGNDASNRDTSDAPLWFGVVCEELAKGNPKSEISEFKGAPHSDLGHSDFSRISDFGLRMCLS